MPQVPGRGEEAELLRRAMRELVGERGLAALTGADVERRAGLDPGALARTYGSVDACFAAVWSEVDAELAERTGAAFATGGEWVDGVRSALREALVFLAEDPSRAHLYTVDVVIASGSMDRAVARAVDRFRDAIVLGGGDGRTDGRTRAIADGIAGGIWHRTSALIRAGRAADLPGQLGELMYFVVLPFRGAEAAEDELHRG